MDAYGLAKDSSSPSVTISHGHISSYPSGPLHQHETPATTPHPAGVPRRRRRRRGGAVPGSHGCTGGGMRRKWREGQGREDSRSGTPSHHAAPVCCQRRAAGKASEARGGLGTHAPDERARRGASCGRSTAASSALLQSPRTVLSVPPSPPPSHFPALGLSRTPARPPCHSRSPSATTRARPRHISWEPAPPCPVPYG